MAGASPTSFIDAALAAALNATVGTPIAGPSASDDPVR